MVMVMITEGNNVHSPEYHAEVTAAKIIQIAESASPEKVSAARDLRKKIETILVDHHQDVHDDEQGKMSDEHAVSETAEVDDVDTDGNPVKVTVHRIDTAHHTDSCENIYREIVRASQGTVLASHFQKQEVREAVLTELHHETRSQMLVHRLVHIAEGDA